MSEHIRDFQRMRVHMIGIGGSSMSGLAEMLFQDGYAVTGSDSSDSDTAQRLRQTGIRVSVGHHPEEIEGARLIVYSAAIREDDPEREEAARLGIPQMERAVLLGQLMEGYQETVCVAGTHGKTTTSAMIAQMLVALDQNPTVHLGGELDAIGGSTRAGGKGVFVAEACEFNHSFMNMPVTMAVLLNIEKDHLDCYGDMEHLEQGFLDFLKKLPSNGIVIANGGDKRVVSVLEKLPRRAVTFGLEGCDWTAEEIRTDEEGNPTFSACLYGKQQAVVSLMVAGEFNILHALAALAVANELGLDLQRAADSLSHFTGAHRRFEKTGEVQGMLLYHDYGHNPAEMAACLSVAKLKKRRVIAVMQPHTFSRVITQFSDYLTCTREADITLVTDIYGAREKDPGTVNSGMLVDGMKKHGIRAHLTPAFDDAEKWLLQNGQPGDLVVTMGCGNINLLNEQMQRHFDQTEAP